VAGFNVVPSIKFEFLLPVAYDDPDTGERRTVQLSEVIDYIVERVASKYGGYTTSNPYAPPPLLGGYQGEPSERNFWAMLMVRDDQAEEAVNDVKQMLIYFQQQYNQREILCHYYPVNRFVPI